MPNRQLFLRLSQWSRLGLVAAALLAGGFGAGLSRAEVNLKNGNFYITYTDLIVPNTEFAINRTYNSKANKSQIFGFGWGSPFDTSLSVSGIGSVVVHENGSGARRTYNPSDLRGNEVHRILDEMIGAMEGAGWLRSDAQIGSLRRSLATDAERLSTVHTQLVSASLIPRREVAIGQRLTSSQTINSEVIREAVGFYRRGTNGHERFSLNGDLVEEFDASGNGFRLRRSVAGNLREIVYSNGTRLDVETDTEGRITRISNGEATATYEYDGDGNLIRAVNIVGTAFEYEYDENHNMRFIHYEDGRSREIGYHEDTQFVAYVRNEDGHYTTYEYGNNPLTEEGIVEHYYTTTREFASQDAEAPARETTVTYRIGIDQFGRRYTAGYAQEVNGVLSETRNHPCGSPILIRRGDQATEFDYDDECRMIFKKTGREEIRLAYDPRSRKISQVVTKDLRRETEVVSDFEYDIKGNLVHAQNSREQSARLTYNTKGQISRLSDQSGRVLLFTYGAAGKPTRIEIEGLAAIDVTYDSSGNIDKVDSPDGHQAALQVTQAFQALLALVKPAGVDFNM
ncbi:RHS repeat protein [Alphaproteobacteria bacterium KMM 3653]|uniref:RHS repeat protein n=1 Tax=Harenicola maris TaxID=2841044 RepID=A0AAP2G550_9RHOB|nr:RHS repeat protein [Harenicola maris]